MEESQQNTCSGSQHINCSACPNYGQNIINMMMYESSVVDGEKVECFNIRTKEKTFMKVENIFRYEPQYIENHPRYRLSGICVKTGDIVSKFCNEQYVLKAAEQLNLNIITVHNQP